MLLYIGRINFAIVFLFYSYYSFGQQDPLYSQSSFNILQFNPAYAGSADAVSGILTYRNQWSGIEGSPTNFNANVHTPIKSNLSIGVNFVNDKIGVSNLNACAGILAYRVDLKTGFVQFGIQGIIESLDNNYEEVKTTSANDPSFAANINHVILGNTGAGVYYSGKKVVLGASLPTLLNHGRYYNKEGSGSKRYHHLYLLGGYLFTLSNAVKLRSTFVNKTSVGAPFFLDVNGTLIFHDVIWVGMSVRTTKVMSAMAQIHLKSHYWVGYSYDFSTVDHEVLNAATHEFILGFDFIKSDKRFVSPRYF